MTKYVAYIFELPDDSPYIVSMLDPALMDKATLVTEADADDLKTGIGKLGETLVKAGHKRDWTIPEITDADVSPEFVMEVQKYANDLQNKLIQKRNKEHAEKSRAREPEVCNHGKLVKVDDIGAMSSGYYYHVIADGEGGWKPANDGTNYCDDWPGKK